MYYGHIDILAHENSIFFECAVVYGISLTYSTFHYQYKYNPSKLYTQMGIYFNTRKVPDMQHVGEFGWWGTTLFLTMVDQTISHLLKLTYGSDYSIKSGHN